MPREIRATIKGILLLCCALSAQISAQEFAPIMPLASRSLLLDLSLSGTRIIAAGERGHILYSDDRGDSWLQSSVPTMQMLTSVHFTDESLGWAAGHDGLILASKDSGITWRVQRDGIAVQRETNLELREQARRRIGELKQALSAAELAAEQRAELEMEMEDAQLDAEDASSALQKAAFTSPLMDVWFQDADRGWAVGAFGALVATLDGGDHWFNQPGTVDNPDEFHLNTITGDGQGRVFIAGEGGVMYRSIDGGQNWETLEPFYEGSWFGAVYNAEFDALLVFGLRGNLFRSTDFGTSWQAIVTGSHTTLAGGSSSASGEIVLVGGVGTVLRSVDGGQSFQRSMMEDRLSLSSGIRLEDRMVLIGQGGAKTLKDAK